MGTLDWGRHYAMVDPTAFRIEYAINPYMNPLIQPDAGRARAQWDELAATLRARGATVEEIPALLDAPDMVYAMNLGLVALRPEWSSPRRQSIVMSHMRHPQRRIETPAARAWFESHGFAATHIGRDGIGAHFESGDAFPFGGELVVGHGPRTDELALRQLADDLGVQVRAVRIVHPGMYHLDLAFCPLDTDHALVCPSAFDEQSASALLDLVPHPIVLSEEEALESWCANSVVVGQTVVMPACPPRVQGRLAELGFEVVIVDVSEFHLGGGSIRCLTNPLDITVGRDLDIVSGGRVVAPGVEAA